MARSITDIEFVALLRTCTEKKNIHEGKRLHADIVKRGLLEHNPYLASSVINMYTKCGELAKAEKVLYALPVRDLVSWNALLAGYSQQGYSQQALDCFRKIRREGLSPDAVTFTCIVKACGDIGTIKEANKIHDEIVRRGLLGNDVTLGNALIDMYVKRGLVTEARQLLEELPFRNVITWSTLISGYVQQRRSQEALTCFQRMQRDGLSPNVVTYISLLNACASITAIDKGIQIHDKILTTDLLEKDIMLGSALIDMYAKCGVLAKAEQVLEELHVRNVACWNALITGYAQQGRVHEAIDRFYVMQSEGVAPDAITFISVLKACSKILDINNGKRIHDEIVSKGLLEKNIALGTALVDMYIKFDALSQAKEVLRCLSVRDTITWSALIAGYAQESRGHEALYYFEQMQREGFSPNSVTLICILKACGSIGAIEEGRKIHIEIVRRGLLEKDTTLGNALVGMYAKCGMLKKAEETLEELPVRSMVSWSVLIAEYAQMDQYHEALDCFERMQGEGFSPDVVIFICILKACGATGAIVKGDQIHDQIGRSGLLEANIVLGNSLIDMYAKCGMLIKAQEILEELLVRDVVSWNAAISGFAQLGQPHQALNCFECMQIEGIFPNGVTFLCVLTACSHSGMFYEAEVLFGNMINKHGVSPNLDHHLCMVAVFGYTGQFGKAMSVIKVLPSLNKSAVWLTILSACRTWVNIKLGILAFDQIIQMDNTCTTAYVLMAHIFLVSGMHEDAENLKAMIVKSSGYCEWS